MPPDAGAITRFIQTSTPIVILVWLLCAAVGAVYADRLRVRARRDLREKQHSAVNGPLLYNAQGNLRRASVRLWKFVILFSIGLASVLLVGLPFGLLRELVRLFYLCAFLGLIALLAWESRRDEQHDRHLRALLLRHATRHHEGGRPE